MKILHVINSLTAGGAENLVVTIVNQQILTHEVSLFTFYSDNDIFSNRLSDKVNFYPNTNNNYLSINKIRGLYQLMKIHDVIHVHLFPPFYIVAFLSIFLKKNTYIYTEHNTFNRRRRRIFKLIENVIYSRYNLIICVSEGAKTTLREWMGKSINIKVINNVVNIKEVLQAKPLNRKELNVSENTVILCMVGSFQKQKDQDTILKAMKLLPEKYILLLIGAGEREISLKEKVDSLQLKSRVIFLGLRGDVYSILKCCDYGILSSNWEGFGIVALEYMACDILSIGTNVMGLREVIGNIDCLFEVGDHSELADKIKIFEANPDKKNKILQMQNRQLQIFKIDTAIQEHFKVYKKKYN